MVKSMTGFGKARPHSRIRKSRGRDPLAELKQLDLSLRLPAVYRQSEYEIRNLIRTIQRGQGRRLRHGRVAGCRNVGAHQRREVFREYLRQMNDTLSFSGIDTGYDHPAHTLMRCPDVVATGAETISEEARRAARAVEAAAAHLDAFRGQEAPS